RQGRLRRRHFQRLDEADPRRPALPAARRRRPRARVAPRAPAPDAHRRAAPRPAAAVPAAPLRGRPVPAVAPAERDRPPPRARARLHALVPVEGARRMVPELRTDELRSCALYADAWTNDARLTLANVRAAADHGAVAVNYAEVAAIGADGAEVLADDRVLTV